MKTYRRCDDQFVSQEFGSEGLLLSLQTGQYFSLNHTAMAVWKLLEEPTCLEEIARKLSIRYEADLSSPKISEFRCGHVDLGLK